MRRVYRFDFTVPDAAIDRNGHVNNVQYVQWMQDVAILHSDATGCMAATAAMGAQWVVRSHRIEYLRPALAGDRIAVFTWVAGMRKVRSLRKYRFVRAADGEVLAQGETDWAFVDAASGRPRPIPDAVSGLFEVLGEDPVDLHSPLPQS
ncbi:MAG: acyl-CoA thioesterase [Burkholderiales bacterium]